jgi:hypothetical protein
MKLPFRQYFATLLLLSATIATAQSHDFTGSYTLTKIKGGVFGLGPKKGTVWSLEVVQTATAIEVTKVRNGQRFVNAFSLDGTEGICNDPGGNTVKCKGQFKGKYLYLDSLVIVQPKGGPTIQTHTIERWELSADLRTLTIQNDVETTDSGNKEIIPNNIQPWAEVYTRN